jgi:hypothetical protein
MRKEAKLLRDKSVDSLILSIEMFNRPSDQGRIHAVLILLDHSFEMLLKSAILHRGGRIRERGAKQTMGFDAAVRKAVSDASIQFLKNEQALTVQIINSLRDAAQHHLLDISEQHLYLHCQSGLTLFRDVFKSVFDQDLRTFLPARVLPLSTSPPTDLETLFYNEVVEVRKLLKPGGHRRIEAQAKLRALAIIEGSIIGEKVQPGVSDLNQIAKQVEQGQLWDKIFPGVASINFSTKGYGPSLDLRIIKKEGIPVQLVPEGTPGATVVAVKRVDELGFYSLGRDELAAQVGLNGPQTTMMIRYLNLSDDPDCFKAIAIGKSTFKRYSQKAITAIKNALKTVSVDEVWKSHGIRGKKRFFAA